MKKDVLAEKSYYHRYTPRDITEEELVKKGMTKEEIAKIIKDYVSRPITLEIDDFEKEYPVIEPSGTALSVFGGLEKEDFTILKKLINNYKDRKSTGTKSKAEDLEAKIVANKLQIDRLLAEKERLERKCNDLEEQIANLASKLDYFSHTMGEHIKYETKE